MLGVSASAFIDKYHPQKDGKSAVSIRITHRRKRKFYPTGITLFPKDFERIITAKRRSRPDNEIYLRIVGFLNRANETLDKLPLFTFSKFEDLYLQNREAVESVYHGFDNCINELKLENRIGTATSYETAKNSLMAFRKTLSYADIDRAFLKQYENWMLNLNKSKTTIGIYLRSLRTIYNRANIDKSLYPFGEGSAKYSIPTSRNIKKALTLQDVSKIFFYKADSLEEQRAKDLWIFIYLCNGLNVKDLCELKRKNIEGDILRFERSKTKRTKKEGENIVVSLKAEAKEIIKRWGQSSINSETHIFPYLKKGLTAERERKIVQQLTKTINKYMKRIASKIEISRPVTTYYARHSFATILKNSGVSIEFISEALGHSDMKTTKSYLAGFEENTIHEATKALTAFN